MNEDIKQQLRSVYEQIPDREFFKKLLLLCNIFLVSKVEFIPKE